MNMHKLAVSIGAAAMTTFGAAAWATDLAVPNTFAPSTTISSSQMNANFSAVQTKVNAIMANTETSALKTAVDANTSGLSALNTTVGSQTTDVNNLKGNLANGSCRANDGTVDANAVRVGSVCVDKFRQTVTIGTCSADGTTNCGSVTPSSGGAAGGTTGLSFSQAARACANAGKRLLTPGEWLMARTLGTVSDMTTDTKAEWVDVAGPGAAASDPMQVGYAGTNLASAGSGVAQIFVNAAYDATGLAFVYFRCAR
jgi:hypothetical protein